MYLDRKIVVVCPAGRRRYMELLFPYILALREVVDVFQVWVNTDVPEDLSYIEELQKAYPDFVVLERLPPDVKPNVWSIHYFFRKCVDQQTVYVRFDDDVVCMQGIDEFKGFLEFRIQHPEYFVVYPVILNNAIISFLQKEAGNITTDKHLTYECFCPVGISDPKFAEELHRQVLDAPDLSKFYLPNRVIEPTARVSINCISWLGSRFHTFAGVLGSYDEEEWIARTGPGILGQQNCMYGKFVCVHFAFRTQRERLDTTDILGRYRQRLKTNE